MTIPSRPAPAPPGSHGQSAAAGANASLEQLRLQLQQQQQQQQQHGTGMQKLMIKLPPPPKGSTGVSLHQTQRSNSNSNNNNNNNYNYNGLTDYSSNSSITRKFPQARYAPATNWDDSPFDATMTNTTTATTTTTTTNGNFKKVPPPRPPPPKLQATGAGGVGGRKPTPKTPTTRPTHQTANILTHIFNRKKANNATKVAAQQNATRVYGVSAGAHAATTNASTVNAAAAAAAAASASANATTGSAADWNACWDSPTHTSTSTSTTNNGFSATFSSIHTSHTTLQHTSSSANPAEAQLISFDSPPSSPTFTQKSNSDCVSVDSFSSDSNFSSPNNGSVSQPESGFEDDFGARSRPPTTSPLDPWETFDNFGSESSASAYSSAGTSLIGTAPVRNLSSINTRLQGSNDNPLCNGKSLLPPAPSLNMPTIIKPKISQKPKAPKPPVFSSKPLYQHTRGAAAPLYDDSAAPPSPPMPQCAPPPPPPTTGVSLLDVISGKVDAIHLSGGASSYVEETLQPYGVALYDFDGAEEGDLSFRENEKIYLLEQVSDEWYRGRTRAGCEGIFPVNYIDVKVPLEATAAATSVPQSQSQQNHANIGYPRVRCLYNFPADVEGDLALKENDLVTIVYKINEDWLYGEVDGRQGQFPSNFLEYIPINIPMP